MEDQVMFEEITNDEVLEVAEDIVEAGRFTGLKIFGGVVALAGLGYGAYRLIKKLKAKKADVKRLNGDNRIDVDFGQADDEEDE